MYSKFIRKKMIFSGLLLAIFVVGIVPLISNARAITNLTVSLNPVMVGQTVSLSWYQPTDYDFQYGGFLYKNRYTSTSKVNPGSGWVLCGKTYQVTSYYSPLQFRVVVMQYCDTYYFGTYVRTDSFVYSNTTVSVTVLPYLYVTAAPSIANRGDEVTLTFATPNYFASDQYCTVTAIWDGVPDATIPVTSGDQYTCDKIGNCMFLIEVRVPDGSDGSIVKQQGNSSVFINDYPVIHYLGGTQPDPADYLFPGPIDWNVTDQIYKSSASWQVSNDSTVVASGGFEEGISSTFGQIIAVPEGEIQLGTHTYTLTVNDGYCTVSDSKTIVADNSGLKNTYNDFLIDSGTKVIGDVLYMILHDPMGDNSYSSFSTTTTYTLTNTIEASFGVGFKLGYEWGDKELFGGSEVSVSFSQEYSGSLEFTFSTQQVSSQKSEQISDDRDVIGPVRGDRYWGEAWTCNWQLVANKREYYNGAIRYDNPHFECGIRRYGEMFCSDANAPISWKALNPAYTGYTGVTWIEENKRYDAGSEETMSFSTSTSKSVNYKQTMKISTEADMAAGGVHFGGSIDFSISQQVNVKTGVTREATYTLYDDEDGDCVYQDIGIDPLFGSYIFRQGSGTSQTSGPHEIGTVDRTAPSFSGEPVINYDTNGDGLPQRPLDTPCVTIGVQEDGVLSTVRLIYSTDNEYTWLMVDMSPTTGVSNQWEGALPGQPQNTVVKWYIRATNEQGLSTEKWAPGGGAYTYTVLNSNPSVTLLTPNGGETIQGTFLVTWMASDPDGDPLTFNLAYNVGDTGWVSIATGVTGNSYSWDTSVIGSASLVSLRVRGFDAYGGVVESISETTFTIIPL